MISCSEGGAEQASYRLHGGPCAELRRSGSPSTGREFIDSLIGKSASHGTTEPM
jgi:hypothetical protein